LLLDILECILGLAQCALLLVGVVTEDCSALLQSRERRQLFRSHVVVSCDENMNKQQVV
jgi:hypothetical protein